MVSVRDVAERVLRRQPRTERVLLVVGPGEEVYTLTHDRTHPRRRLGVAAARRVSAGEAQLLEILQAHVSAKLWKCAPRRRRDPSVERGHERAADVPHHTKVRPGLPRIGAAQATLPPSSMRGGITAWPEALDERRRLVDGVEDALVIGGRRYRFVRLTSAGTSVPGDAPDGDLEARSLFAWCQDRLASGTTLDAMLTPLVTVTLHRALTVRARELAARGAIPRAWADPGGLAWPTLLRSIIACLAACASMSGTPGGGIATLVPRLMRGLGQQIDDFRTKPALALRMLRADGPPRVCRHHAAALNVIFAAVWRASKRDESLFAFEVFGRTRSESRGFHAWNWFVDVARAQIVSIDLSTALQARSVQSDVFSPWLDWNEINNVSAFLNVLFYRAGVGLDTTLPQAAMPRLLDPATPRGLSLLYRLARQPAIHPRARARIVNWLDRHGFDAAVPDWRRDIEPAHPGPLARLAVRTALIDARQLVLLEAIGL